KECRKIPRLPRSRRFLLLDRADQKQIELTFTVEDQVREEASESADRSLFCVHKAKLAVLAASAMVVFFVQLIVLLAIVFSRQRRKKALTVSSETIAQ
uniref:CUB domain-containing protein n=1 Tax=Steinernema glaseri TaxID=37863 RepID=A0A1I7Y1L4_9BILA